MAKARYHERSLGMVNNIGDNYDVLLARHIETIAAIKNLDEGLTIPPNLDLAQG